MSFRPRVTILMTMILALHIAIRAHPHTYIDAELGIDVGPAGVEGLRFRWAPLRDFVAEIAALYDRDRDGRFDPEEPEAIRSDAFAGIEAHHYFIRIDVGGSDFGNLDCTMSFRLADPTSGGYASSDRATVSGLVAESSLPSVPTTTHTNPFVRPDLRLDAASSANPFFWAP